MAKIQREKNLTSRWVASDFNQEAFWREVSGYWPRVLRLCRPHIALLAGLHHAVLLHAVDAATGHLQYKES